MCLKIRKIFLYPLRSVLCALEILFWHRNELKLLKTQNFIYFLIFYFETFPNNTMFSKHRLTSLCFMKWKHFRKIKNSSNFTLTMSLKYFEVHTRKSYLWKNYRKSLHLPSKSLKIHAWLCMKPRRAAYFVDVLGNENLV